MLGFISIMIYKVYIPIPNIIPVLKNGEQKLYIAPGIKENGISATRTNYPFYVWHQEEVNLSPLDTTFINPRTSYISNCIQWEENFNGAGSSFHQNLFEYGVNMISDTSVMSTNGYGEIILDGEKLGLNVQLIQCLCLKIVEFI